MVHWNSERTNSGDTAIVELEIAKEPLSDKRHAISASKCDIQPSQSLRHSQRTVSENCESEEEHNTNTIEKMKLEREVSKSPSNSSVSIAGNELGVHFAISPVCTTHEKLSERLSLKHRLS